MRQEFISAIQQQREKGRPFSVATIIRVEGSASARCGSRAVFDEKGTNVHGWVGGGCAERYIGEQSVEAIEEKRTRIVTANLDDEIFGLGIACGGKMDVFIEPLYPEEVISLPRIGDFSQQAEFFAQNYGWKVQWQEQESKVTSLLDVFHLLAQAIAKTRGKTAESLRGLRSLPVGFTPFQGCDPKEVLVIGRSRITEALARLCSLCEIPVRVFGPALQAKDYPAGVKCECVNESYDEMTITPHSAVIVASHQPHDHEFVSRALEAKADYVAMIGSRKRAFEVIDKLGIEGQKDIRVPLFIPAGIDIDARNPDEIALSIVVEMTGARREI